ncbi:C-type lectin domain family 4 member M-like isoform X1 [Embiotoca jacksoni]|uniref:C-type lectin domain family 4 member M-like isoform X1 n=1 Tax=Embiotoca jacksoni TaxID=100190 RepID=UPI0037045405
MENSRSQSEFNEEMLFERRSSQDFCTDGRFFSRQTFGKGLFAERGGSAFPHHQRFILSLGLLDVVLLVAAIVIGMYCAKAKDLQIPNSEATPLLIELNYLRNQSDIIRAKLEAKVALANKRSIHVQLQTEVMQKKTLSDLLQKRLETLLTEKRNIQFNKTSLENSCGRCPPEWLLLKSSCYYFSHHDFQSGKNWPDSRADCISQGGDLLVINDLAEQQLMMDIFPKWRISNMWWMNGLWIGLTDAVTEGTWVWINNVTEEQTTYWKDGQPIGNQSRNCGALYSSYNTLQMWYNRNCREDQMNSICETEPKEARNLL